MNNNPTSRQAIPSSVREIFTPITTICEWMVDGEAMELGRAFLLIVGRAEKGRATPFSGSDNSVSTAAASASAVVVSGARWRDHIRISLLRCRNVLLVNCTRSAVRTQQEHLRRYEGL